MKLSRNNHYIPRMYLNNWCTDKGDIYTYRLLVSDERVPEWNRRPVSRTGSETNLYLRVQDGIQTDDFEHDLDRRFESPAKEALEKAISSGKLTPDDWHKLTDFVCSLYVRTPSFYLYSKDMGMKIVPEVLEDVCKELETITADNIPELRHSTGTEPDLMPISLTEMPEKPDDEHTMVEINTVVGKSMWLLFMRHSLEDNSVLRNYFGSLKWSIVTAHKDVRWPTTDTPVAIVQEASNNRYSLVKDGIEGKNVFLLIPISPEKALLASKTRRFDFRFTATEAFSLNIKRLIINNALMYIYFDSEDEQVPAFRRRLVNYEEYKRLEKEFTEWFDNYIKHEGPMLDKSSRKIKRINN